MLNEKGLAHTYREYTKDPLSEDEIREVLRKLDLGPREVLRSRDAAKHGIAKDLDDDALIAAMARHPRLLQRPIGVLGDRAIVGRPPEALLGLV